MSKSFARLSLVAAALILVAVAAPAQAAIVGTPSQASPNQLAFPASANDLINTGEPTLGTVAHTNYNNFNSFSSGGLNDGTLGTPSGQTPAATFDLDGTWTSEYNLNLLLGANSLGYTINEIRTIAGWIAPRAGQQYSVDLSTISSAGYDISLGTFTLVKIDEGSSLISITDNVDGIIATGVDAIRFSFVDPTNNPSADDATVYREIDVLGFEDELVVLPVPEPATAALLGLGALGLVANRRRHRAR
jgi:hypothetical protein